MPVMVYAVVILCPFCHDQLDTYLPQFRSYDVHIKAMPMFLIVHL